MTTPAEASSSFLARTLDTIIGKATRQTVQRWKRRRRAILELEQVRRDLDGCSTIFASIQGGGSIPQGILPTTGVSTLSDLHAEGLLTEHSFSIINAFFQPALDANHWATTAVSEGPPGLNGAQRFASLLRGRRHVAECDQTGLTLREQAIAEIANARSTLHHWWRHV